MPRLPRRDEILWPVNPITFPAIYDAVLIGGIVSPGVAKLSGFSRGYDWEVKKAKGSAGATATADGSPLAEGTVTLTLWEDGVLSADGRNHFSEWESLRQLLATPPAKEVIALDIFHPYLQDLGITTVVVKRIGALEKTDKNGVFSVSFDLLEYKKPVPAGGTPTGATPVTAKADPTTAGGKPSEKPVSPPPSAKDAQDEELEALTAEAFPDASEAA